QTVVFAMRACSHGSHAVAFFAIEGPVYLEGFCLESTFGDFIKYFLCIKGTVIFAYTRMVSAYNHVAATVVLSEGCMEQSFARACVSHVERISGLYAGVLDKIVLGQGIDCLDSYVRRDVACLEFSEKLVDEDA